MKHASRIVLSAILLCLMLGGLSRDAGATDYDELIKLSVGPNTGFADDGLAISGEFAAVGASFNDGSVRVYRFDGSAWTQTQVLTASDADNSLFGGWVALDGDRMMIGAILDDDGGPLTGAAYFFEYDGSSWVERQKLVASDPQPADFFGINLELSGDVAVIGANGKVSRPGAAYVFRYDGSTWVEEQKLVASDAVPSDQFGNRIAVDGEACLIGTPGASGTGGAAYYFRYNGSTWVEEQKITPSQPVAGNGFGSGVALDGGLAMIGAVGDSNSTGAAFAFEYNGSTWLQTQKLVGSGASSNEQFGSSVALEGGIAAIGSWRDNNVGSCYVFRRAASMWSEDQRILASDAGASDNFGSNVALSESFLFVAAESADGGAGAAYMFSTPLCLNGTVNQANGGFLGDVLYIQGSTGGPDQTVELFDGDVVSVSVLKPVTGGNGRFVLHADIGTPNASTAATLPFDVGTTCFPFLLNEGATPVLVANNIGKTNLVGSSNLFGFPTDDPESATTTILFPAFPVGTVLTFQGVILDPGAVSSKGASVTNGVVLEVLP